MAELPRPNETEISHSCQIPDADTELSFLVGNEELIDKRLTHTERREDEKKSKLIDLLYNQVRLSNRERDEMVRKYEAEAQELSESKKKVLDLLKEKEDWHVQLWECKTELLKEKEEHLKTLQKIKSLADQANKDLDLKQREITELQDRHRSEVGKLQEETAKLKLACEALQLSLNEANIQLRQEEPWRKRCDALEKRHQRMLRDTILARRNANQGTQTALNKKFKAELAQSQSLRTQLEVFCEGFTTLENSHKLLLDDHAQLQESNRLLMEDHALLEEICLMLKRKTLGIFGRRMQERNLELQKMKRKMRESQGQAQAQATTETQAQAPTGTQAGTGTVTGGSTHEADGPRPLAPSCFLRRLEHLYD